MDKFSAEMTWEQAYALQNKMIDEINLLRNDLDTIKDQVNAFLERFELIEDDIVSSQYK